MDHKWTTCTRNKLKTNCRLINPPQKVIETMLVTLNRASSKMRKFLVMLLFIFSLSAFSQQTFGEIDTFNPPPPPPPCMKEVTVILGWYIPGLLPITTTVSVPC